MIGGTILSALLALLVGRPILKLRGYYLAVATLGLGLLIAMVFTNESELTGGPNGMQVPRLVLFGWRAYGAATWYWIAGITLIIGTLVAVNLIESPTGRAIRAIHDSETASRVLGIDVAQYKLLVFVLSAIYAAIADPTLRCSMDSVTPTPAASSARSSSSSWPLLGGLGSILGSIVGAAILVILPQVLTLFAEYEHIVLGLIMIVFMIFLPAGIVPTLARRIAERMS